MAQQVDLDLLPAVIWQAEAYTWRFSYVSGAAASLLGHPPARWLEDADFWVNHIHPDDRDRVVAQRFQSTARGGQYGQEYRFLAGQGRIVWVRDTVQVIRERGRPDQLQGVMLAIDEPGTASRPIGQLAQDAAFHIAPVGLALIDADLRFVRVNKHMAVITGVPVEAHLGRPVREILGDFAGHVEPLIAKVMATGTPVFEAEFTGESPSQPDWTRHWAAHYFPVDLPEQGWKGTCIMVLDRTDRWIAEHALRASEAKYRFLYNRTPVMMHSIDRAGHLISVSDRWLEVLGYERDEVIGRLSVDFLTPASRTYAVEVVFPEFFRTGVCHDIPYEIVRKDGTVLDVLVAAIGERDASGEVTRSLSVLIDVTERKRTEAALHMAEEQLRQAQKMEAIGRLAGGIAHDFNNLLVAILGHGELLMELLEDAELREHAEQMYRAGERAAALTRQILAFSRHQIVRPQVLNINDALADAEKMLRRLVREDIEQVIELAPDIGSVRIDRGQLGQVLMNLVMNASDAMPKGGRLALQTCDVALDQGYADAHVRVPPGRYVRLTVSDTGMGMEEATLARIFEPFFTTKEVGHGTGLGLSMVYGIIKRAGGYITIDSAPGRGTRFQVFLPRVDEPAAEPSEAAPAAGPTGTGTVLVAEDDALVRELVRDILERAGYDVLLAPVPAEALVMARERTGPIVALVADMVMPGMTGDALAEQVRAVHPEARVLFMSGYTASMFGGPAPRWFLQKPFTRHGLLTKMHEMLTADR